MLSDGYFLSRRKRLGSGSCRPSLQARRSISLSLRRELCFVVASQHEKPSLPYGDVQREFSAERKRQRHRVRCRLPARLAVREDKQQGMTLPFHQSLPDSEDAHVAARLGFQPARFTAIHLSQHAPAPYFRSTTLHCNDSTSENSPHYKPLPATDYRFRCVFICQKNTDA